MGERRKRGRPPRVDKQASSEFVQGRCTPGEKELWVNAARAKQLSLGQAMRFALTAWARQVLGLSESEIEEAIARGDYCAAELEATELEGTESLEVTTEQPDSSP